MMGARLYWEGRCRRFSPLSVPQNEREEALTTNVWIEMVRSRLLYLSAYFSCHHSHPVPRPPPNLLGPLGWPAIHQPCVAPGTGSAMASSSIAVV